MEPSIFDGKGNKAVQELSRTATSKNIRINPTDKLAPLSNSPQKNLNPKLFQFSKNVKCLNLDSFVKERTQSKANELQAPGNNGQLELPNGLEYNFIKTLQDHHYWTGDINDYFVTFKSGDLIQFIKKSKIQQQLWLEVMYWFDSFIQGVEKYVSDNMSQKLIKHMVNGGSFETYNIGNVTKISKADVQKKKHSDVENNENSGVKTHGSNKSLKLNKEDSNLDDNGQPIRKSDIEPNDIDKSQSIMLRRFQGNNLTIDTDDMIKKTPNITNSTIQPNSARHNQYSNSPLKKGKYDLSSPFLKNLAGKNIPLTTRNNAAINLSTLPVLEANRKLHEGTFRKTYQTKPDQSKKSQIEQILQTTYQIKNISSPTKLHNRNDSFHLLDGYSSPSKPKNRAFQTPQQSMNTDRDTSHKMIAPNSNITESPIMNTKEAELKHHNDTVSLYRKTWKNWSQLNYADRKIWADYERIDPKSISWEWTENGYGVATLSNLFISPDKILMGIGVDKKKREFKLSGNVLNEFNSKYKANTYMTLKFNKIYLDGHIKSYEGNFRYFEGPCSQPCYHIFNDGSQPGKKFEITFLGNDATYKSKDENGNGNLDSTKLLLQIKDDGNIWGICMVLNAKSNEAMSYRNIPKTAEKEYEKKPNVVF